VGRGQTSREPAGNRTRTRDFADQRSPPGNRLERHERAGSGTRTRIVGTEARDLTFGRCPRDGAVEGNRTPMTSLAASDSTVELPPRETRTERDSSCSRELHSPSPVYQTGTPLSGPEQRTLIPSWNRSESNRLPPDCRSGALPGELRSQKRGDLPFGKPPRALNRRTNKEMTVGLDQFQ
jgi:hypothetical protein